MEKNEDTRELIITSYLEIVAEKSGVPVISDFASHGIKRHSLKYHFGNIEKLHVYMAKNHKDEVGEYYSTVDNVFTDFKNINSKLSKKRFVITTAVADAKAHMGFLGALKKYCTKNDAQVVIMPAETITNSFEKRTATFDKIFHSDDYTFISEDIPLNENLLLCSIQVSAKQIRPITGLSRLGNREGSYIFASPKQFLEYVPSGNSRGKNYAIMTPGACTLPNYYSETFVSKRLSYIADQDHTLGAIIVEVEDDRLFHFRQIQADSDGSFVDLGVKYFANGRSQNVKTHLALGDLHSQNIDNDTLNSFLGGFRHLNIGKVFLHDVFDAESISHHINTIGEQARRVGAGTNDLGKELTHTWSVIENIRQTLQPDTTYIVKSNHDEFLDRYLNEGRYLFDPQNHYLSLKIAPALFGEFGGEPLKAGFHYGAKVEKFDDIVFLGRSSSVRIHDVECGVHGDLGLNGAKASLHGLERTYGRCVIGHAHTAAIHRGVFRVGTFSQLDMGYNRGPSSWTHTGALVYENGQVQLVNKVNGKFYMDQKTSGLDNDDENLQHLSAENTPKRCG